MKTNKQNRKLFRQKDLNHIQEKIDMLGSFSLDAVTFTNLRSFSTVLLFLVVLYITKLGYVYAPFISIFYYYGFYYFLIERKLKRRVEKLDHEALYFFEILTLTLESGRNLENSLQVTVDNIDSELAQEFRNALSEIKFGKSLIESLNDMKKRIPSETINNIILNITQTNVFGNSILETMYNQIEFLREKQILEIKGQINKIPNKVSIISVIFIVPLILLMILGPFVINLIQ